MTSEESLVDISQNQDVCNIKVNGDMTIYTASKYKDALLNKLNDLLGRNKKIVMDLSSVSEIDSAGFQILVASKKQALKNDVSFTLASETSQVNEVIGIYDMADYFKA